MKIGEFSKVENLFVSGGSHAISFKMADYNEIWEEYLRFFTEGSIFIINGLIVTLRTRQFFFFNLHRSSVYSYKLMNDLRRRREKIFF